MTTATTRSRIAGLAGAALIIGLVSGCGRAASSSPAVPLPVAPAAVRPPGAQAVQYAAKQATGSSNCLASLAPAGPLPALGRMPAGSYMATIAKRGYMVAGVDQNSLLWGYRDPSTGQLVGFDIDMVSQIAAAIFGDASPVHLHLVPVRNQDRITAVKSGQVDVVAETMTINCDREKEVDFSSEYYDAGQAVLVPKNSPIASEQGLAGRRVCASATSTSLQNLANLQLNPPVQLWEVTNQPDCLVMLQQGQVDAISTDDTILEGLAAQDPQVRVLTGVRLSDEPYGMAISKAHPEFTRFVNAVLAREEAGPNSTWQQIWSKWLSATLKTTTPPAPPTTVYRGS